MNVVQEQPTRDLQLRLNKLLKELLKPAKLKSLVVTRADRYTIRGIVLMVCPIERREFGRDFEVGLAGDKENSIWYVTVDGRRLLPKRTKTAIKTRHYQGREPPEPHAHLTAASANSAGTEVQAMRMLFS